MQLEALGCAVRDMPKQGVPLMVFIAGAAVADCAVGLPVLACDSDSSVLINEFSSELLVEADSSSVLLPVVVSGEGGACSSAPAWPVAALSAVPESG